MKPEDGSEFWKTGLHRELGVGETAEWEIQFADEPDALARFEEEVRLNRLIQRLPNLPVSSNFTSRVMQSVEVERQRHSQPLTHAGLLWRIGHGWGRRLAFASVLILAGFFTYEQYQTSERRELAQSILQMAHVLPSEEIMRDFGAMSGLRQVSLTRDSSMDLLDALP